MQDQPVTLLLQRMENGDRDAAEELYGLVYEDLRERARRMMAGTGESTLQPTAVLHEAWLKLGQGASPGWRSRAHFLGVAAKAMRSVFVDHVRSRRADKRGGASDRIALDEAVSSYEERAFDLLALDEALERMERFDADLARVVELRFFGGLSIAETARVLDIGTATVERNWRTARTWLRTQLDEAPPDGGGE